MSSMMEFITSGARCMTTRSWSLSQFASHMSIHSKSGGDMRPRLFDIGVVVSTDRWFETFPVIHPILLALSHNFHLRPTQNSSIGRCKKQNATWIYRVTFVAIMEIQAMIICKRIFSLHGVHEAYIFFLKYATYPAPFRHPARLASLMMLKHGSQVGASASEFQ